MHVSDVDSTESMVTRNTNVGSAPKANKQQRLTTYKHRQFSDV